MTGKLLPQRRIVESSESTHAFCYLNVPVTLGGVSVVDIQCSGKLCNAYGMDNNLETATSCGCFNLDKYDLIVTRIYELTFQKKGDESSDVPVHVKDYTSKSFTKTFLKDGKTPTGVNSAAIT